ncbi:hypothetical protein JQS43_04835 [Natronosporangium hydrolyticum]|uniref:Uncharacterized protein n=1 Tax=Natronosporangium hydrolyticum TaxID=2811111 RepID=A0A895YI23_9ACTN|nr:hypothetical protein [Natronosporangium hydrolyticum]QSB15675.1 hypothetical protein JQS43_04835 [Natronosporangium hydrolyticum]
MVSPDFYLTDGAGGPHSPAGRSTDVSLAPFEKHPADLGELETVADRLTRLADRGIDLEGMTDRRFQPAVDSWDGLASAELRAAPQPVRQRAEQSIGALAWAAAPLHFWREQVRLFNSRVDGIETLRAEARTNRWGVPEGDAFDQELVLARAEHERQMRDRWREAHQQFIDEGAQAAAGMLRQGPTADNLALLTAAGVLQRPTGALAVFLPQWHDQAMADLAGEVGDLIDRINDPNYVPTTEELAQLEAILAEHADDDAFAYHLMMAIGPDGLLKLTGNVAFVQPAYEADPDLAQLVGSIQNSLAIALATATTKRGTEPPHPGARYQPGEHELPSEWMVELLTLGRQKIDVGYPSHPNYGGLHDQIYGHQLLGVLMQSPDAHFDSSFLTLIGGDMLDFERNGGWSVQGDGIPIWMDTGTVVGLGPVQLNWIPGGVGNDGYDPVVGLMSALERNPDAARDFFTGQTLFDGTPGGRLPRVDYLLTDRFWFPDYANNPDLDGRGTTPGQALLGDVLVRATTEDPDERSHRIVESIIYEIATDETARGFPNNPIGGAEGEQAGRFRDSDILPDELRESMGEIAAFYIDDMHWNMIGRAAPDGAPGDHVVDAAERHAQIFLAELGKNPDAREQVQMASAIYSGMVYDYYLADSGTPVEERIAEAERFAGHGSGLVYGALDFGHNSNAVSDQESADSAYNDALRNKYFLAGLGMDAATSKLPGPVGSVISEMMSRAEEAQQAGRIGDANYEVGDVRQQGRELTQGMADAALYRNLTPEQVAALPADLLEDGEPIPYHEWSDRQQRAWDGYISEPGSGLSGIDDVDGRYDDGYDRAQGDLESY